MVHERQGLAFSLETSDDLARVHAGLDDLERHLAAKWVLLLGHENDAETALADFLQELVGADYRAGTLPNRFFFGSEGIGAGLVEQAVRLSMASQQNFNTLAQSLIPRTSLIEISRPLIGWVILDRREKNGPDFLWVVAHGPDLQHAASY